MTATVSVGRVGEFDSIVLENSRLRAVILPALGGRVWELEDLVRSRQWIWHREGVPLRVPSSGAAYDDVWAGGWEELFPNDAPGTFERRELPDHGEWWALRWSVGDARAGADAVVRLRARCSVVQASCTKEFRLDTERARLSVSYAIRSEEPQPFHFLFKQHLAVRLTPECRLLLPGGRAETVDPSFGTMVGGGSPFDWPVTNRGDGRVDLRVVPPSSSGEREFLYVRDLPAPWCGVEDAGAAASLRMEFDSQALPYVWLFLTYGGWRDLYTAVLEPCTNLPKDLTEAVRLGQSARLEPGKEFRTAVSVVLEGPKEAGP